MKRLRLILSLASPFCMYYLTGANGIPAWLFNCTVTRNSSLPCPMGPNRKGRGFSKFKGSPQSSYILE